MTMASIVKRSYNRDIGEVNAVYIYPVYSEIFGLGVNF
jgi:hypothetical protein